MRVAAIGLCALPLAAGYADARSVDPSRGPSQGRFSPQGRGGGPGPQGGPSQQGRGGGLPTQGRNGGLAPQGGPPVKAQVSPAGEQAGGQSFPPGRHQGGARSPHRDPSQEGPAQQGGPAHERHHPDEGSGQEASSPLRRRLGRTSPRARGPRRAGAPPITAARENSPRRASSPQPENSPRPPAGHCMCRWSRAPRARRARPRPRARRAR